MENSLCRSQRWALETVNIKSKCIKNMMWVAGSGRLMREFQLCTSLMAAIDNMLMFIQNIPYQLYTFLLIYLCSDTEGR